MLAPTELLDEDAKLRRAGVALATVGVPWQDGLDVLAVLAELKPLAILMRRGADVAALAARHGLKTAMLASWGPAGELPPWYAASRARWRARQSMLHVAREPETLARAATLAARGWAAPAEEAALLGYPLCCVEAQQRRSLALEALVADMVERSAEDDPARRTRIVEAGAVPLPLTDEEYACFARVAAVTPSAVTSVNLCDRCAADAASPARRLEAQYQALAARAQYRRPSDA
ncbi:MAG: hypothetical protein ACREFQ_09725 [Stellaceae bacterium]